MVDLEGKVALITGGEAGLGSAIAAALLAKGCKVALLDIDEKQGTKTAAKFQQKHDKESCVFYKCDVTNEGQLEDCFKNAESKFGALDILVNNAGIFSEQNWRKMFAINIDSVYSGILLGFKYMGKDKGYDGGHIINTASIVGEVRNLQTFAPFVFDRPEDVARGVIKPLEDGQNGAALVATNAQGLQYYNFQEPTPEM